MPLVKARIAVSSRDGGEIGCIEQRHFLRKWYFDLTSKDRRVGTITVESRRGWEFRIDDAQGVAAGRISKLMRGSVREVLAPTREYELSLNENASAELRALALAAAVCIHPTLSDEELDALLRTSD